MQKPIIKKGGAREGAGAKRKEKPLKNKTLRFNEDQLETLEAIGGNKFLRGFLDLLSDLKK